MSFVSHDFCIFVHTEKSSFNGPLCGDLALMSSICATSHYAFLHRDVTEDERWHLSRVLSIEYSRDNLRFCDFNDWLRLKVDFKALL